MAANGSAYTALAGMGDARGRAHHPVARCGIANELRRWANRPANQLPAAIGADEVQLARGTVAAVRALKGANECLPRIGREVLVAAFAVGSDFEGHIVWCLTGVELKRFRHQLKIPDQIDASNATRRLNTNIKFARDPLLRWLGRHR